MKTLISLLFFGLLFLIFSNSAFCESDEEEIRQVLVDNFEACNREDIDALMDTCSMSMPDRPGFKRESEILFEEKDVHYSLEKFKLITKRGDYAEAWIVQRTYAEERGSDSSERKSFRHGTTLLPQEECVEYKASFKRERGSWKCLMTISHPVPYRE